MYFICCLNFFSQNVHWMCIWLAKARFYKTQVVHRLVWRTKCTFLFAASLMNLDLELYFLIGCPIMRTSMKAISNIVQFAHGSRSNNFYFINGKMMNVYNFKSDLKYS